MEIVFLTTETFIKQMTSISDNVAGKYMRASLIDAQEIQLKRVIGTSLLERLKEMVQDGSINNHENAAYKNAVGYIQPYLAYLVMVDIAFKLSYKYSNIGVHRNSDSNVQTATFEEIIKQKGYYQAKADAVGIELQKYLVEFSSQLPELSECQCSTIRANLRDAVSCGIFLGGRRGVR